MTYNILQRLASAGASDRQPTSGQAGEPGVIDEVVD